MIFSRFFTPDHAKPDPKIRKAAVEKLQPSDPKARQILHELAFNDESPEVNLAALTQLNSFALWQKMAQIAKNERVKKAATQQVKTTVLASDVLSPKERLEFLLESADSELVFQAVEQDKTLLSDTTIALQLIGKINRPNWVEKLFADEQLHRLQGTLVAREGELAVLNKWHKKAKHADVKAQLDARMDDIKTQQQRPGQIQQAATLVLSKWQALNDNHDYINAEPKLVALEQEFASLEQEFSVLKERDRDTLLAKKDAIASRVRAHMSQLAEVHEVKLAEANKQAIRTQVNTQLDELTNLVGSLFETLESATLAALEQAQTKLQDLSQLIESNAALIGREHSEPVQQALGQLASKLTKVPEWQRHTQAVNSALAELQQAAESLVSEPQGIKSELAALEQQFYAVFDQDSPLASSHKRQWFKIKDTLKAAKKAFDDKNHQATAQLRKTLNIVASLVSQGKYRAAMAKFDGFTQHWSDVDDGVRAQVQKKFDDVAAQISRLEGWQSYLAAPRKPALLDQAQALVSDTTLTMPKRAEQIKLLRKQWQSLSVNHAQTDDDIAQDQAFDYALEQAFAPCRVYFAEQDAKRKAAIEQRQGVLNSLAALLSDDLQADDALMRAFDDRQKQWLSGANIPQQDYTPLKQRFDQLRTQINQKLTVYLDQNKAQKERLIRLSQALLENEHSVEATDKAKSLQQEWKSIPSAGKRVDGKLWKTFRDIHNQVFERAKEAGLAHKSAQSAVINSLSEQVNTLINESAEIGLGEFLSRQGELEQQFSDIPKKVAMALTKRLNETKKSLEAAKMQSDLQQRKHTVSQLLTVLDAMEKAAETDLEQLAGWTDLPKSWQQALLAQASSPVQQAKALSTSLLSLEIVLGVDSPVEFAEQRKALQMQMLQDSFNTSEQVSSAVLLEDCLRACEAGQVSQHDITRLGLCAQHSYVDAHKVA